MSHLTNRNRKLIQSYKHILPSWRGSGLVSGIQVAFDLCNSFTGFLSHKEEDCPNIINALTYQLLLINTETNITLLTPLRHDQPQSPRGSSTKKRENGSNFPFFHSFRSNLESIFVYICTIMDKMCDCKQILVWKVFCDPSIGVSWPTPLVYRLDLIPRESEGMPDINIWIEFQKDEHGPHSLRKL